MLKRTCVALALCASTVAAKEPLLGFPVDCSLGDTCYIQQYLDHAKGPTARDFRCSTQSYNDHSGTDIALNSLAQMDRGVNVIAAAPGAVVATRDGVIDRLMTKENAAEIAGAIVGTAWQSIMVTDGLRITAI